MGTGTVCFAAAGDSLSERKQPHRGGPLFARMLEALFSVGMRIREIAKRGSWLYDGSVRATVAIVRQNYFEGPEPTDEPKLPEYPPADAGSCFYAVEYEIPGASKGAGGRVFGTAEEAIGHAEATLRGAISWDS